MSFVFSFRILGNLLNKSPIDIIMLAFTPNSMFDCKSLNKMSILAVQIFDETHMYLHKESIADLSMILI